MKVLSLFDGISCGQIALNRAKIPYSVYYASEVDKYAIQVTTKNYPDTIQLGDVKSLDSSALPKIDLLLGGSPCQGFSILGKQLNFKDPRSKLFFEYLRLKKELSPKYFIFENVPMNTRIESRISSLLEVDPVILNSADFSAQNRKRLYWTNIPIKPISNAARLRIVDILEDGCKIPVTKNLDKLYIRNYKSTCLDANYAKGADNHGQRTGCIQAGVADIKGRDINRRVYSPAGKSPTLTAVCGGHQEKKIAVDTSHWRKLTPVECERLQTIPDNYTEGVSNSQRYKMVGNGWTVDVVAHILRGLK